MEGAGHTADEDIDLDQSARTCRTSIDRRRFTTDEARPDAVARRRANGRRTTRENIADLCDPGSFTEYSSLAVAARAPQFDGGTDRAHAGGRSGDGARPRQRPISSARTARIVAMSYDYTVLAGTQGLRNHQKKDRHAASGAAMAAADRVLHRGRRRQARRHRQAMGAGRPQHHDVLDVCEAFRARAAGRHQFRTLLRGQCGAARMLRRHHRDGELHHRHGRPRDDRRRRPGRLPSRRSGTRLGAGAERRDRRRRQGRSRRRGGRETISLLFPGRRRRIGSAPISGCCAARSRKIVCASTTCAA